MADEPLTVAIVAACPFPEPRGTPVRILRMAEGLAARGHHVHVVTYHLGSGEVEDAVTVHRIPRVVTYRKRSPGPSYQKVLILDALLAAKLASVLRRHRVDVIHAHHAEGFCAAAAARLGTGIPLIYDAHTLLASELPFYPLGLPLRMKRFLGERLDRLIPRWSDHVISVTEKIRDKLVGEGGLPEERISVISNGVELELFAAEPAVEGRARDRLRRMIFTGNLAPYQGIDLLLLAFREILQHRSDVRLQIVTDSSFEPYEPLARRLAIRASVDLIAAGFDKIPALLAGADMAVNPRTSCDGIPLKLLNYMAAAKPVVSFAGSAVGIRHQETGWVVENGDVAGFARAALTLLADSTLADELGRNARTYVEEHHSWQRTAERTEEVYRRLIEGAARSRA
ncbi:MAG TPA: glycosyltransferase family 4 protein [Gemmatimonadota bacterium]|nr:glycosyltransferase family 4 protein [Gemmatimonadota bacterium]